MSIRRGRAVGAGLVAVLCLAFVGGQGVAVANTAPTGERMSQWPMHRFNAAQDGFNPVESRLGRANVGHLRLRGTLELTTPYTADAPVVAGGILYVTGYGLQQQELLYAFDAKCAAHGGHCAPLWTADVGFNSQPRLAVGAEMVFVASNPNTQSPQPDGRLWAFPARCGIKGATCSPAWVADFPGANPLDEAPTVADGMVFVTDGFVESPGVASVFAFDVHCGHGGASCTPRWQAPISVSGTGSVAVSGGIAYTTDYGQVSAFDIHCGTGGAVCRPLWQGPVGIVAGGAAVADGKVFVDAGGQVFAFPARCAQAVCAPLWHGGARSDGTSEPAVADGIVYMASDRGLLFAFPVRCRGHCAPLWTATLRDGHIYVGNATPAVANGVVYLTWSQTTYHSAQRWLVAFPTTCTSPCKALLVTTAGFYQLLGPAVANGHLYLGGGPYQGPGAVFTFG